MCVCVCVECVGNKGDRARTTRQPLPAGINLLFDLPEVERPEVSSCVRARTFVASTWLCVCVCVCLCICLR